MVSGFVFFFFFPETLIPISFKNLTAKFAPHQLCSFSEHKTTPFLQQLAPRSALSTTRHSSLPPYNRRLGNAGRLHAGGVAPEQPHTPLLDQPPEFGRTRWLVDKIGSSKTGSFHWGWLNAGIYDFCISKARTIQKL